MSVEQLKGKTTSQLAELGKKTDVINRLKGELGEKTATIFSLEAREKALKDQLHTTEDELTTKTSGLRDTERTLADKQAELVQRTSDFDERSVTADSQKIEIVVLKTQVDALQGHVDGLERDVKETGERLARERDAAALASKQLAEERGQVERLGDRVAQLELQLKSQTAEAQILGQRVVDLEARLAEQGRLLAERERERDQLRLTIESARKIEADLRQELASLDRRHDSATEALKTEKVLAETQLERAREDRAKLQRELASMKREAEATWASERVENALLRERINDVAAEVTRLTSALEGPGSPIETLLTEETQAAPAASNGAAQSADEPQGSLADRIRALQTRASRLSSAT
jgi:chromosome segregation ATPase